MKDNFNPGEIEIEKNRYNSLLSGTWKGYSRKGTDSCAAHNCVCGRPIAHYSLPFEDRMYSTYNNRVYIKAFHLFCPIMLSWELSLHEHVLYTYQTILFHMIVNNTGILLALSSLLCKKSVFIIRKRVIVLLRRIFSRAKDNYIRYLRKIESKIWVYIAEKTKNLSMSTMGLLCRYIG